MGRRRRNSFSDNSSSKTGSSDGSRQAQQSFLDERREPLQAVVCVARSPLACLSFGAPYSRCDSVGHALTIPEHEQVLADCFETRFEPFTAEKPRVCFRNVFEELEF